MKKLMAMVSLVFAFNVFANDVDAHNQMLESIMNDLKTVGSYELCQPEIDQTSATTVLLYSMLDVEEEAKDQGLSISFGAIDKVVLHLDTGASQAGACTKITKD